jgi:serine/threonine-protein kinase
MRGLAGDVREIGRALKVNAILEGSVRQQDNRARIHVQLIDVSDGTQLWAEKYERQLTDVFEIQDQITAAIVTALELELPRVARNRAAVGTRNVRAHELYLKGRYWWHRANPSLYERAADLFREAIACDPFYAAPYSGLADTCFNLALYGYSPPREMGAQAEAAARKALELDETSAEAHCSLGLIEGGLNWNTERCGAELSRCLELNPSYALGMAKYGTSFLSPLGRLEEAHDYILRGLELDPLSPNLHADLTLNFAYRGQWDRFEAEARTVLEMDRGVFKVHQALISAAGIRGDWSAAVDAADTACAIFAGNPYILGYTAWVYAGSGQIAQAKAIQDRLMARAQTQYIPPVALAIAYLHTDTEAVFTYLEKACEIREPLLRYALWHTLQLQSLRSDSRFQELRRRVGL